MLKTSVDAARRELQLALSKLDEMERVENDASHLAVLWGEFLNYANRVFNKLSHGPKHGPSKGWFDHVKHVRKTDQILSYILHARNADTHGVERIAEDSKLVTVQIRPLSSFREGAPIKGKIVDNAFVDAKGNRKFIQSVVRQTNPLLYLIPVIDSGIKYLPPAPGFHLNHELADVNPIDLARLVTNYLGGVVSEAESLVL